MSEPTLLPDRAVISISGQDARHFLKGIVTQDLDRLAPETAVFSALLTPQGKIIADFFVVDANDSLLVDCDKANAPGLLKRLTLYKLRAKVSIDLVETLFVLAVDSKPSTAGLENAHVYRDVRCDGLGWRMIAPNNTGHASTRYDENRIAHGVPEFGKDFGPDAMFLMDVNYDALNAVSYKKGCFVGQEVSSRMKRKGEPRRRTLIAEFEGEAAKNGGDVTAGGTKLGELMSRAGNIALASIRMDRWGKAKTEKTPIECGGQAVQLRVPDYLEQG
ncbi:YgfZ/GcvT domain-containing protein [Hyphococcus sp.]|uniref:CAF17-like 4Fe-4S cluster assembly/insertion protein YgfZ n=1 Tax=Hyphococcus sp. TaxID=2038636 RepID=UPI003CCC3785